jgi:hypothetical protein
MSEVEFNKPLDLSYLGDIIGWDIFYLDRLYSMDRSKIVAVITGIISIVLAIAYLLIVQIIDFRGEMLPAPIVDTIVQGLHV